jgi:8-oxo-dGTP pyrophosphatase MutT (NUDIX family)
VAGGESRAVKTKHYLAAGGIVLDELGHVLTLERDVERDDVTVHEVRLPKGHVDDGETDQEAAVRETCEESGYCDLEILADLGMARSEYTFKDRHYVRDEHYFLMRLRSPDCRPQDMHPDSEEALFRAVWAPGLESLCTTLSYESEREFAQRALVYLQSQQP